jgi:23S rRNA-/tRNA-specific pseudouridylate synthase
VSFDPHEAFYQYNTTYSLHAKLLPHYHQVYQVTRLSRDDENDSKLSCSSYPVSLTNYIYTPLNLCGAISSAGKENILVLFEDNDIAILNKPEGITTMDSTRTKGKAISFSCG